MNPIQRIKRRILGIKPARPITLKCEHHFVGSSYGGWNVATKSINADSIIYSVGVGEDASFDIAMNKRFGCKIFAFDPTPKAIEYVQNKRASNEIGEWFDLHKWAISKDNGTATFHLPTNDNNVSASLVQGEPRQGTPLEVQCRTLSSIMNDLGHTHIDLLKLDIEGSEYEVIDDIVKNNIQINQLHFEVHETFFPDGHQRTIQALEKLESIGYQIFAVSRLAREYSLLRK